jgi:hypothetical protein
MKEPKSKKTKPKKTSSPASWNYESRLEEAVRISNERYDLLAKATNDAIWDWDFVTGKVVRTAKEARYPYSPRAFLIPSAFHRHSSYSCSGSL